MGLVDELRGLKVSLDTAPIIYFIEKHHKYLSVLRPVFVEIDAGNIEAITSTITLLEVLIHPFRTGNEALAEKYRDILLYCKGLTTFEILHEVSETSSRLRAKYSIKTPDAIQNTNCCGNFVRSG
ncbi:MAG: PIN domain-containing protein [Thermodesulfobacteriota bacterium]